jgi:hypothetical protein
MASNSSESRGRGVLSTDMDDPDARPYFLWSEEMTNRELREIIEGRRGLYLQGVYLGRLLREARLREIWQFITPADVVTHWSQVQRHLGRRRQFWEFLLRTWRRHGLLPG